MRGYAAARLLRLGVRNPPGACMSDSCEYFVLSGRSLCNRPIPRPEESYSARMLLLLLLLLLVVVVVLLLFAFEWILNGWKPFWI